MASGLAVAALPGSPPGANERIRPGIIFAGHRGTRIVREGMAGRCVRIADRFSEDRRTVIELIYPASHLRSPPAPG